MGSVCESSSPPKPWVETPCILSAPLSKVAGCNIYLKLENLQPSGSFKSRGVGNMMFRAAAAAGTDEVHFYCSSGGNAGLACATSAAALRRRATIVVPQSTPPHMVAKLHALSADVVQAGANWAAADAHLREQLLPRSPAGAAVYVPPFDHPDIWAGAATLVDELAAQLPAGAPVDGVVCSVGGGGLLCGVVQGVRRAWAAGTPAVLAVETEGAHSLAASVAAGELVTLPGIASVATSLGATRVCAQALAYALGEGGGGGAGSRVESVVVSDAKAVMGAVRLLDDARILVEPACGATLALVYNGLLRKRLGAELSDEAWSTRNVVLVVCGGSNINLDMLMGYKKRFGV